MKRMKNSKVSIPRRDFLQKSSAIGAGLMVVPSFIVGQSPNQLAPSEKLNIALVGVGGRGRVALQSLLEENIVACCDVHQSAFTTHPYNTQGQWGKEFSGNLSKIKQKGTRWFNDYRVMFEKMADKIDAVVVTTPDHMHFPIALSAVNLGKHVYCEKPMTHTVEEARLLTLAAKKAGVITQMGNQGHSNSGTRSVREWIQAGVIGKVREVHSWTNRPGWPQGMEAPDHSQGAPEIPDGLQWDLWQGVAKKRAYDPAYLPFNWRAYFDYGSGAFGDMACHIMDVAYWALDLGYPDWLEAAATPLSSVSFPQASMVTYHFPSRGKMPEVLYKWYDGRLQPPLPASVPEKERPQRGSGTFIIGEEAVIISDEYGGSVRISPSEKFEELKESLPPKTIRRIKGDHHNEWANAIKENRKASSDFSYAGPFTEMVQLGNIASRMGTRLHFDSKRMQFTKLPNANQLLRKEYPDGWILS